MKKMCLFLSSVFLFLIFVNNSLTSANPEKINTVKNLGIGGSNVVGSVTEVVTSPWRETRDGGAIGFGKGVILIPPNIIDRAIGGLTSICKALTSNTRLSLPGLDRPFKGSNRSDPKTLEEVAENGVKGLINIPFGPLTEVVTSPGRRIANDEGALGFFKGVYEIAPNGLERTAFGSTLFYRSFLAKGSPVTWPGMKMPIE